MIDTPGRSLRATIPFPSCTCVATRTFFERRKVSHVWGPVRLGSLISHSTRLLYERRVRSNSQSFLGLHSAPTPSVTSPPWNPAAKPSVLCHRDWTDHSRPKTEKSGSASLPRTRPSSCQSFHSALVLPR